MRYYLDAEFNGFGGALISIALVPETGGSAPFYAAVDCTDPTPWVAAHVMPKLDVAPVSYAELQWAFADYLATDPDPVLIADWPEDIVHAARLLVTDDGRRLIISAVRFELAEVVNFSTSELSHVPHNAYHDAVALRTFCMARRHVTAK
ncbi:hypothetical protein SKP52_14550 [Sphingopyxis fribergensis]|uniref:Uncharacterized protein n=1 Tax=Sphingopyxis fribergensis TaxID=1515612 RepID=A0A0A7PIJ8_9SPHN|nr:hypothetical protein [Sphingopyxis fribergensis]AJA09794.1 hypothetical protein SKP52_14550 [Sphingopyxis fribergensis]